MFKDILIPVDPANLESSNYSIELAKTLLEGNGKISLMSVIEELPVYVSSQVPGDFEHNIRVKVNEDLCALAKHNDVTGDIIVKSGHASGTIIEVQKAHEYDLIIVASHKPHRMDHLLGSTASRVVRKAQCPVFVAR